ncbi:MAG TPA: GDSL-type esterase/lipase family protein, partial [Thermoanaerobaculia bacterium]|nr:GDSL-type esterase/lipase family protein [Thermoanaerobaculia bacterium]
MKTLPFAAFLLLLAGCGPEVPNLDSPGTTIVCLGDSITSGVGAEPEQPYPGLLAEKLGVEVINAGVPGDTSEDGLARVEEVLALDPWMVIVELGGNDILRQVTPARSEAALRKILDRLLAARVVPVLVEIEVPFRGRYAEVFERIDDDYDIPIVEDTLGEILLDADLKADPIHPNAAGQRILAEAIADVVEPIVEARKK